MSAAAECALIYCNYIVVDRCVCVCVCVDGLIERLSVRGNVFLSKAHTMRRTRDYAAALSSYTPNLINYSVPPIILGF